MLLYIVRRQLFITAFYIPAFHTVFQMEYNSASLLSKWQYIAFLPLTSQSYKLYSIPFFLRKFSKSLTFPLLTIPLQYWFIHFHFILSYKTKVCHNRICRIPSTALHFSILQCQNIQQFLYIHLSLKETIRYAVSDHTSAFYFPPLPLTAMRFHYFVQMSDLTKI